MWGTSLRLGHRSLLKKEAWQDRHRAIVVPPSRACEETTVSLMCRRKRGASARQECDRLSRNVAQPDYILANPVVSPKAERRPGSGEIWFAVTKHDGVQVGP
jgi:hypothetical protein